MLESVFQLAHDHQPPRHHRPCSSALLWGWIPAELHNEGSQIASQCSPASPSRRQSEGQLHREQPWQRCCAQIWLCGPLHPLSLAEPAELAGQREAVCAARECSPGLTWQRVQTI